MKYGLAIIALVKVEWSSFTKEEEPCCPDCKALVYGGGQHKPQCILNAAINTQDGLQTAQQREALRIEYYRSNGEFYIPYLL